MESKRPTPSWGEDIVQSSRKREAVLKLLVVKAEITPAGCWEWKGSRSAGYGTFRMPDIATGKILAHRAAWVAIKGEAIPDTVFVCHHCDNPACFNPDHLFLGSQAENIQDAAQKDRLVTGTLSNLAKYDDDVIAQVKRLLSEGHTGREICRRTGVSASHISRIRRGYTTRARELKGKNWVHGNRKYPDDKLRRVAAMLQEQRLNARQIAEAVGVSVDLVKNMKRGTVHKQFMERARSNVPC